MIFLRYGKRTEAKRACTLKRDTSKETESTHSGQILWLCLVGVLYRFYVLFFKLQLLGRLHGAAGYIVASLLVIAMAFHFGKVRAVYVYHHTYKVMQQKLLSKFKERMIAFSYFGWYWSTFIIEKPPIFATEKYAIAG